jgi:hypothetical protein
MIRQNWQGGSISQPPCFADSPKRVSQPDSTAFLKGTIRAMLTIRKEQLKVFSKNEADKFEDRVVVHLRKIFPEQSEALGEEKLAELIQYGVKRARAYEIVAQRDVCKYIDLMMIFGRDFDVDPKLSWAAATLHEEFLEGHPTEKIQRLCGVAMEHSQDAERRTETASHV